VSPVIVVPKRNIAVPSTRAFNKATVKKYVNVTAVRKEMIMIEEL